MNFGEIVNFLLYAFSGICFGVFASRYSVFSALHIKGKWQEEGISCLFSCFPQLLFLSVSFFLFPTLKPYCRYHLLYLYRCRKQL